MITPATTTLERTQPAYRAFGVTVSATRRLGPSFVRVTFAGDDLDSFGGDGFDQRIKIVFPDPAGRVPVREDFDNETWYQTWRGLPEADRHPFRTYTIRARRSAAENLSGSVEVDVDFVLHGTEPAPEGALDSTDTCQAASGPASRWVANVLPGGRAVVIGPNALAAGPPRGIEWAPPSTATTLLLAGDETAAPAIVSIVGALPPGTRAHAFIEVPEREDALVGPVPDGVNLTWLPRRASDGTQHDHGVLLDAAVRDCMSKHCAELAEAEGAARQPAPGAEPDDVDIDSEILWDVPAGHDAPGTPALTGCYAWIAGEAAVVRDLRRHLVRDLGIDRRSVAFMGYWRRGRAES
ncbi:siderophore-interacting protein [Sanguibacter antarcticus]|uniref:NADPH-dependent ferric siderophore reductase n=1 Tax=Sanguibacter antarcticus TaxID=372484 RepID=A0A2A9E9Y2_9MICO|nr:siderophore-interacting protein [Sanguibacter antarcticus]PFG35062.1 NADPH-dependent ferric siderophore reductase [Sanguibacter antarcticus]